MQASNDLEERILIFAPHGRDAQVMCSVLARDQFGCVVSYVTFRADAPPPANSRFGKVEQAGMVADLEVR